MPQLNYPCPDCRTTNNVHATSCEYEGRRRPGIESAYIEVVAQLSRQPTTEEALRDEVTEWTPLHQAVLGRLQRERRIEADDGSLRMLTAEEYKDRVSRPQSDPLLTIYEKGSVPGAHDNAVFAMIAFYEMVGLTWGEAREKVVEWLYESGTWARGGFEESAPEDLVEAKKHVYDQGYGWREKARAAKAVIDRSL